MNKQQLQTMDQSTLISMITELTNENNSLKESILDIFKQSHKKPPEEAMVLFSDYLEQWLEDQRQRWQLTTYEGYKYNAYKHIIPYFKQKGIVLANISSTDIQQYYRDKVKSGLTSNSLIKHHNNIRKCLESAKKLDS